MGKHADAVAELQHEIGARQNVGVAAADLDEDGCLLPRQVEIAQGNLVANTPIVQSFAFNLPAEPWSFAGHYINIIWQVEVIVDIPLGVDLHAEQPFVMAPQR